MFFNQINLINLQNLINSWWPWVDFLNEIFFLQTILLIISIYIIIYTSVYYTLLYIFFLFFLFGVSLSVFQLDLFTAFLWLIECSVIFVFLLLLFYLNVKNIQIQTNKLFYDYIFITIYILYVCITNVKLQYLNLTVYNILDNSYENIFNLLQNDLFVFFISYYVLNNLEFICIGFLLLIGSIICINLYLVNKNSRVQNYNSFLGIFNFFLDMCSFVFLRKQNLIKQGNTKASLKIFLKK